MSSPVDLAIIGCGNRGRDVYGRYALAHPDEYRVVAVADPDPLRREAAGVAHGLPTERCFASGLDLLAGPRLARAVVVATQDHQHLDPALAALRAGYEVLLEKPMAVRPADCVALAEAAESAGRVLAVAHVLRYTPAIRALKRLLEDGALGEVLTIDHRENVLYWHMAHSYVRGPWRREAESSPMLLAKSCHDLDLIAWLAGRPCERLASFGSLSHFRPERAPAGAPERCTDGCPAAVECPFEAVRIYVDLDPLLQAIATEAAWPWRTLAALGRRRPARAAIRAALGAAGAVAPKLRELRDYHHWPRSVVSADPGEAALRRALAMGPYGRCVYRCDNDVVDHQVVMFEFEGGITASFTMHGHAHQEGRTMRWEGSRATALARLGWFRSELELHEHGSGRSRRWSWRHGIGEGHSGGDAGIMAAFRKAIVEGDRGAVAAPAGVAESHLLAFAAEQARKTGTVVDMPGYRAAIEANRARFLE